MKLGCSVMAECTTSTVPQDTGLGVHPVFFFGGGADP
jgi:hypothetical protein